MCSLRCHTHFSEVKENARLYHPFIHKYDRAPGPVLENYRRVGWHMSWVGTGRGAS